MIWIWVAVAVLVIGGGAYLLLGSGKAGELLPVGTAAPAFTLPNQHGEAVSSAELAGSWRVIYFYPRDDTPGCTKEACTFRDRLDELQAMGVQIYGVSYDDVASHKAFAEKYHLNFDLLADPSGTVIAAYGATSVLPGFARRISYLADEKGVIRKVYPDVTPGTHATEIMHDVRTIRAGNQ